MSISSSGGIGRSRGRVRSYQTPMPQSIPEIIQVIAEEFQVEGIYSIHIEEGRPITIVRYVDPDDLLHPRTAEYSPQEVLRQVEMLIDVPVRATPFETWFNCHLHFQTMRMICSGILIGDIYHFLKWLNLESSVLLTMRSLDRSCDYVFAGHNIYVDSSLDKDRLVLLGGDSTYPTLTSVRVALQTTMELKDTVKETADAADESKN